MCIRDSITTVDVARGVGNDYSAFVVVDITEFPHQIVAKYRDNEVKPLLFPHKIHSVAKAYNKELTASIKDYAESIVGTTTDPSAASILADHMVVGKNGYKVTFKEMSDEEREMIIIPPDTEGLKRTLSKKNNPEYEHYIPLTDEIVHDMAIQPNERFEVEVEDDVITLRRLHAGYNIDQ